MIHCKMAQNVKRRSSLAQWSVRAFSGIRGFNCFRFYCQAPPKDNKHDFGSARFEHTWFGTRVFGFLCSNQIRITLSSAWDVRFKLSKTFRLRPKSATSYKRLVRHHSGRFLVTELSALQRSDTSVRPFVELILRGESDPWWDNHNRFRLWCATLMKPSSYLNVQVVTANQMQEAAGAPVGPQCTASIVSLYAEENLLKLRTHHHRRGGRTGRPVPWLSHPADHSSVFPMYADTPHRTGSCTGHPHLDRSMSLCLDGTPLDGPPRLKAPSCAPSLSIPSRGRFSTASHVPWLLYRRSYPEFSPGAAGLSPNFGKKTMTKKCIFIKTSLFASGPGPEPPYWRTMHAHMHTRTHAHMHTRTHTHTPVASSTGSDLAFVCKEFSYQAQTVWTISWVDSCFSVFEVKPHHMKFVCWICSNLRRVKMAVSFHVLPAVSVKLPFVLLLC